MNTYWKMEASTEFVNFRLSDDNFKPRLLAPLILLQSGYHIKIRHKSTWDSDPPYHKLTFDCIKHWQMAFSFRLLLIFFLDLNSKSQSLADLSFRPKTEYNMSHFYHYSMYMFL